MNLISLRPDARFLGRPGCASGAVRPGARRLPEPIALILVAPPDDQAVRGQLLPDLEVLRRIGAGESAEVYLAREPGLQRLVAVKILRAEMAADPVKAQRFEREAQSAARIAHPNVLSVHRIGRLPGAQPFIVMEYVDGRTVADLLASAGPPPLHEGRRILAAAAGALASAHVQGIVHRDVRPANVFVEDRTGRAVLADFGIAALVDSGAAGAARLTAMGVQLGQTRYLSPEQIRGEPVTTRCDVYAFGILAYEVLTGQGPYAADTPAHLVVAHLQEAPRPLRTLRPDVPADVAALVERCLAKDAAHRPLAAEVAAALAEPAPAQPAAAPADGPLAALLAEARRRRVYRVMVGYGAAAFALLGGAEIVFDAFDLPDLPYQILVGVTLAGFPAALVLSWIYDVQAGRIERTRTEGAGGRTRTLARAAVAAAMLTAVLIGWLILRG